jgi:hypothetical protein
VPLDVIEVHRVNAYLSPPTPRLHLISRPHQGMGDAIPKRIGHNRAFPLQTDDAMCAERTAQQLAVAPGHSRRCCEPLTGSTSLGLPGTASRPAKRQEAKLFRPRSSTQVTKNLTARSSSSWSPPAQCRRGDKRS